MRRRIGVMKVKGKGKGMTLDALNLFCASHCLGHVESQNGASYKCGAKLMSIPIGGF